MSVFKDVKHKTLKKKQRKGKESLKDSRKNYVKIIFQFSGAVPFRLN